MGRSGYGRGPGGGSQPKTLRILPIRNGTVIDHIPAGQALKVVRILSISEKERNTVSIAMNVPSGAMGRKDIVKVENRRLRPQEVQKIALVAPRATINIVEDTRVVRKFKVEPPREVEGLLKCLNPSCITNSNEPTVPRFLRTPQGLRCVYCERPFGGNIADHL
ncbi:MAG: aspartate carbamoyltransferase regulatory subunit [Halobacteria archaeon]